MEKDNKPIHGNESKANNFFNYNRPTNRSLKNIPMAKGNEVYFLILLDFVYG